MRSAVADYARHTHEAGVRAMTPAERVDLAHQLGEQALDIYCATHGVDRATARRALRRQRQAGRPASRAALGALE
jgi:hypothetical protein